MVVVMVAPFGWWCSVQPTDDRNIAHDLGDTGQEGPDRSGQDASAAADCRRNAPDNPRHHNQPKQSQVVLAPCLLGHKTTSEQPERDSHNKCEWIEQGDHMD